MKTTILTIAIIILIIAGLIWISSIPQKNETSPAQSNGILTSQEQSFDFGTISMAAGNVSHIFKIKNSGSEPLIIVKIYTSCMCTEATLMRDDSRRGPFGMPGHSLIPKINEELKSDEEAEILVVFDPAAHGPAGLGKTERIVYLENTGKNRLELSISANVAP